ncbi:hypothetical protein N7541_011831 [Penicillium brevicompactum]|uniref:Uncharacterized protein n=1 Tax=Penicillium brevicompactum TaxID=5074 RepID=A0A9W9QR29_PENBR|nr:hypothetical protein N7541_011831 [Penicillium brevicompactum]
MSEDQIEPSKDLPEEHEYALLRFRYYINQATWDHLIKLKRTTPASPPLRKFFCRSIPSDLSSAVVVTGLKPGIKFEKSEGQLIWLLRSLLDEGVTLLPLTMAVLVDELERLLQAEHRVEKGGGIRDTAVDRLLSQPRLLQRTQEWSEIDNPLPVNLAPHFAEESNDNDRYEPISSYYSETSEPQNDARPKETIKTRGNRGSAQERTIPEITQEANSVDNRLKIFVDARALKVFRIIFYNPAVASSEQPKGLANLRSQRDGRLPAKLGCTFSKGQQPADSIPTSEREIEDPLGEALLWEDQHALAAPDEVSFNFPAQDEATASHSTETLTLDGDQWSWNLYSRLQVSANAKLPFKFPFLLFLS